MSAPSYPDPRLLDNARRSEGQARQDALQVRAVLAEVRDALDLPPDATYRDVVAAVHQLRATCAHPRTRAGERTTDGGQPGHLEVCGLCDGDGLLFRPDELPPAPAPSVPAQRGPCHQFGNRNGRCLRPIGCLCTPAAWGAM